MTRFEKGVLVILCFIAKVLVFSNPKGAKADHLQELNLIVEKVYEDIGGTK